MSAASHTPSSAEAEAAIERGKEHMVLAQQPYLVEHQLANLAEELDLFVS